MAEDDRVTYIKYKYFLDKARKVLVPPTPRTLAECIEKFSDMSDFYRGKVEGLDGSTSLIFCTKTMMDVLKDPKSNITALLGDGIFSAEFYLFLFYLKS